jgi:hypothetical protein
MFKANPALLTAYISSRCTPEGLLLMLQENKDHLNSVHISAALTTLVKLAKATGGAAASAAAAEVMSGGQGWAKDSVQDSLEGAGSGQGSFTCQSTASKGLWATGGYNRSSQSSWSSYYGNSSSSSRESSRNSQGTVASRPGSSKPRSTEGTVRQEQNIEVLAGGGHDGLGADALNPAAAAAGGPHGLVGEEGKAARVSSWACMGFLRDWLQQHRAAARVRDMALAAWACHEVSLAL